VAAAVAEVAALPVATAVAVAVALAVAVAVLVALAVVAASGVGAVPCSQPTAKMLTTEAQPRWRVIPRMKPSCFNSLLVART
jgi:hypothetical protein